MRAPAIRRAANPLSIWIAMLAIVLQSVMPMAAQARLRMMAPVAVGAETAAVSRVDRGLPAARAMPMAAHAYSGSPTRHVMPTDAAGIAMHHGGHAAAMTADGPRAAMADPETTVVALANEPIADPLAAVATDTADPAKPVNPHAMHGDAPCPYCRVHLDVIALPPVPNPHWVLLVSVVPRPVTDEAIPVTAEAWSPARQRGPPPIA